MANEKNKETVYENVEAKAPREKYDFTKLNTLAVVSLATAITGFGAAAAVITGHVSLAQIKKSDQAGRGLAIAGVAAGYTIIGLWILSTLGFIAFSMWGTRYGMPLGGSDDHMRNGSGFGRGDDDYRMIQVDPGTVTPQN